MIEEDLLNERTVGESRFDSQTEDSPDTTSNLLFHFQSGEQTPWDLGSDPLTASEPQHQVQSRRLFDLVVGNGFRTFQLSSAKHQSLLVRRNTYGHNSVIGSRQSCQPSFSSIFCFKLSIDSSGLTSTEREFPDIVLTVTCMPPRRVDSRVRGLSCC
jgi:hypothetical protein